MTCHVFHASEMNYFFVTPRLEEDAITFAVSEDSETSKTGSLEHGKTAEASNSENGKVTGIGNPDDDEATEIGSLDGSE